MDKKLDFEFLFAESDTMLACETYSKISSDDSEFHYNCRRNTIGYAQDCYYSFYVTPEDNELIGERGRIFLTETYVESFLSKSQKTREQLDAFYLKLSQTNLAIATNGEIFKLLSEYLVLFSRVHSLFMASQFEPLVFVEKKLKGLILIERLKKELGEIFSTLVTNSEFDLIKREALEFTKFASNAHSDKELLEYAFRNSWLFWNCHSNKNAIEFLKNRIVDFKQESESYAEKKKRFANEQSDLIKKQQKILASFENRAEIERLALVFQKMSHDRLELKSYWVGEFKLLYFFEEIAKRIGVSVSDLIKTYRLKEIEDGLLCDKPLPAKEVENRKKHFLFLVKDKKLEFYSGVKAFEITQALLPKEDKNKSSFVQGITANSGVATGKVRIVHVVGLDQLISDMKDFREGEILITSMTQPTFVTMAKKAAAIVTDEGGLTSHAAVIAREFKIPCIVGCKIAMKTFKTGDLIEVDANKGIVRKIS